MENTTNSIPAATVGGLFRTGFDDLIPLTEEMPLTPEDVQENSIVIGLELAPEYDDESIIVDVIVDNADPIALPDLIRGYNLPYRAPFWFHWFDIPACELGDATGKIVDLRAPGTHTLQIRTATKVYNRHGRIRNFSPANGGWMSPVYTFVIAQNDPGNPDDTGDSDDPDDPDNG